MYPFVKTSTLHLSSLLSRISSGAFSNALLKTRYITFRVFPQSTKEVILDKITRKNRIWLVFKTCHKSLLTSRNYSLVFVTLIDLFFIICCIVFPDYYDRLIGS